MTRPAGSRNGHERAVLAARGASAEEAAAIVAALERFLRDTAPAAAPPPHALDGWRRAALMEAVERDPAGEPREPWINT